MQRQRVDWGESEKRISDLEATLSAQLQASSLCEQESLRLLVRWMKEEQEALQQRASCKVDDGLQAVRKEEGRHTWCRQRADTKLIPISDHIAKVTVVSLGSRSHRNRLAC